MRRKKQTMVARFSVKAEYRSMTHGYCELLWLKNLMEELRIASDNPIPLFCDNKFAINLLLVIQFNIIEQSKLKLICALSRRK
jgi:hypothetical protein